MRGLMMVCLALSAGVNVCGAQQPGQIAPPGYFLPGARYERPQHDLVPVYGGGVRMVYGPRRVPTATPAHISRPALRYRPIRISALPGRGWYLRVRPQAPHMLRR